MEFGFCTPSFKILYDWSTCYNITALHTDKVPKT